MTLNGSVAREDRVWDSPAWFVSVTTGASVKEGAWAFDGQGDTPEEACRDALKNRPPTTESGFSTPTPPRNP